MAVERRTNPGLLVCSICCVILLFVCEGFSRSALAVVAETEFGYDFRALRVLAEQSRGAPKVVWLIGDSTVLGLDVPLYETPGPVLERRLRSDGHDVEVRPVARPGGGLEDIRLILAELPLRTGDVALVSIHLGLATNFDAKADGDTWQARVEHRASRLWDVSALVRYADYLARIPILVMQEVLPQRMANRLRRTRPGPERRAEWTGNRLRGADLEHLAATYGDIGPVDVPVIREQLRRIHEDMARRGVPLLTYVAPLNRAIVEQYGYANWSDLSAVGVATCEKDEVSELVCLNLVDTIGGDLFYDDDHLMAEGYRKMVEALTPAVESHL
jgi:hypothetical protein